MLTFAISLSIFILIKLILCLIYQLRKYIIKPLIIVRDSIKVLEKENLDIYVDIKSHDELGDFSSAFNRMARDLKISRDKIHE